MAPTKITLELQNFWRKKGLTQADAARVLGVTPQALSGQMKRPLSKKTALLYRSFWPELNVEFLTTGLGNVTTDNSVENYLPNADTKPVEASETSVTESLARLRLSILEKEVTEKNLRISELERQVNNLIQTINTMAMGFSQPGTPYTTVKQKGDEDFIHKR